MKIIDTLKTFKVLSIGNSFSEDAHTHLFDIAVSMGFEKDKIIIANLYLPGASLSQHAQNLKLNLNSYDIQIYNDEGKKVYNGYSLYDAILKEKWDYITLQQSSPLSGLNETCREDLDYLIEEIKRIKNYEKFKIGWHMTWAYDDDCTHPGFKNYNNSQKLMYEMIIENSIEIMKKKYIDFLIPNGLVIQKFRDNSEFKEFTRDGYHLNDVIGKYIAGLTFFISMRFDLFCEENIYLPSNLGLEYKTNIIELLIKTYLESLNLIK